MAEHTTVRPQPKKSGIGYGAWYDAARTGMNQGVPGMKSAHGSSQAPSTEKELEHVIAMICRISPWWLHEMSECVGAFQAIERVAELRDPSLGGAVAERARARDGRVQKGTRGEKKAGDG